ncbi:MAG: hypothetical protein FJW24_08745 [Acidimicrobiia bacterium]|nr:hypothetical protein [Acidimicrobiia bacterium]
MPIVEPDPWRRQYFASHPCPRNVVIPTDDPDCWTLYPRHRWVYDKLMIAQSQGLVAGPHGVMPPAFPIFSKPTVNLKGMGAGSRTIRTRKAYLHALTPGHMWMPLLKGAHISTDVALIDGRTRWWRHAVGVPTGGGTFDHWKVEAKARPRLEARLAAWTLDQLRGYTGVANFETIDDTIIEAHLRFSDQWPDLYGPGWVKALIRLYAEGRWRFADRPRRDGYSVVLFGPHGTVYAHPPASEVAKVRRMPDVSSVQITFHADKPPQAHAMPPGGFRLAVVNAWSLAAGRRARARLKRLFGL